MSFVSHAECTVCGTRHNPKGLLTVCATCGQMLAVRYDLDRVKAAVTKDALRQRAPGMYRFRELTPLDDGELPVTLGEGGTPLLELPRLAQPRLAQCPPDGRSEAPTEPGSSVVARAGLWCNRVPPLSRLYQ